jgi:hypothetical protein
MQSIQPINKITITTVLLLVLFVCIPISSQDRDKSKVNIHIDGSSKGVIDKKDYKTDIYFHFWINGEMEYNKELSYASRFVYKIKSLTAGYSFKKFVLVKDPPEECTHDTSTVYEERNGRVEIPSKIDVDLVIDYGAGITKNALESIKDYLPPGVEIPDVDVVPAGFYELRLESVVEEIVGRRYAVVMKQCTDLRSTVNLDIGDVEIGCQIKEDGTLSGKKKWESSYTGGTETSFKVEGCEEEEKGKKVKDPIKYDLKWHFMTDDNCKYKIMKALANVKDKYEEGVYTRLFDLVDRLLEENESAFKVNFDEWKMLKTIKDADKYLRVLESTNYNHLRNDLFLFCRKNEGEGLIRALATLDEDIDRLIHNVIEYKESIGDMTKGQVYFKEQLVKRAQNDKHYLSLYIKEGWF